MRIANDKDGKRVFITYANHNEKYFCPQCGLELIQRRGSIKTPHFSHKFDNSCCDSWHYDMSDWHYGWQEKFPEENREVILVNDGQKHRADILVDDIVIEFQHSPISAEDFKIRNDFYTNLGKKVVWLFDMQDEFRGKSINYLDVDTDLKFKWNRPLSVFKYLNEKSLENKNISIYFQLYNSTEDENDGTIIMINWISPTGFHRFCTNKWLSCKEFIELHSNKTRDVKNKRYTIDDLVDKLIQYRNTNNDICFYGCPIKESREAYVEDCDFCVFNCGLNNDWRLCKAKFRDIPIDDIDAIIDIDYKDQNVISFTAIQNSINKTYSFKEVSTCYKSLIDLWNEYQCKVIRVYNVKTHYIVQINRNPIEMHNKYRRCYGKLCKQIGTFDNDIEVIDYDKAQWVVKWFK